MLEASSPPEAPAPVGSSWEDRLAAPMFLAGLLFLIVLAGWLHRYPHKDIYEIPELELEIILRGLAGLWLVIFLEAVFRFLIRPDKQELGRPLRRLLLVALVPPLRLGVPGQFRANSIWLPLLGWRQIDKELRRTLERGFAVPMIAFALMILPLLVVEHYWDAQLRAQPALALGKDIGTALIWLAFAVEFIIMISVDEYKLRYCTQHWIDLAIVLLPLLEALPIARLLRLGRLLRLEQLARLTRLYRLQGLALKAWRASLLLGVIQRLVRRPLEKQLQQVEAQLAAKEAEVADLRRALQQLREQIEERARATERIGTAAGAGKASGPAARAPAELSPAVPLPSEGVQS